MTAFDMPDDVKNEALILNGLHIVSETSERFIVRLEEVLAEIMNGKSLTKESTFDVLSAIAQAFMTINLVTDELAELTPKAHEWSKHNQGHREEIVALLKETEFMKRIVTIATENIEERAFRMLTETMMQGMNKTND